MSTQGQLYLISALVKPSGTGVELMKTLERINLNVQDYSADWTKVRYRFKVTGEPRVMAVIEVNNVLGLERTMAGLSLIGNVEVTCEPVISFEACARSLGVDEKYLKPRPFNSIADDLYMLLGIIDHHGMSQDDFLQILKEDMSANLGSAAVGKLDYQGFKVVGERKFVSFLRTSPEIIEQFLYTTPMMKMNGQNVKLTCRAIQDLQKFTKNIAS